MNTFAMPRWSPRFVRSFHEPGPPAVHFPAALELFEHSTGTTLRFTLPRADANIPVTADQVTRFSSVSGRRIAGDEVYGRAWRIRTSLRDNGIEYVTRVGCAFAIRDPAAPKLDEDEAESAADWNRVSADGHSAALYGPAAWKLCSDADLTTSLKVGAYQWQPEYLGT